MNIQLGKRERIGKKNRQDSTNKSVCVCVCVCVLKNIRGSIDQADQKCFRFLQALQTPCFLQHCHHSNQIIFLTKLLEQIAEVEQVAC